MYITTQMVRAADVSKATRIANMREAIKHLETAITAYDQGDDNGEVSTEGGFVAMFEAPNGPISLAAAAAAVRIAALGISEDV